MIINRRKSRREFCDKIEIMFLICFGKRLKSLKDEMLLKCFDWRDAKGLKSERSRQEFSHFHFRVPKDL